MSLALGAISLFSNLHMNGWNLLRKVDQPRVSKLYVYPIKSCQGIEVSEFELVPTGVKNDRQFLVVYANTHNFITQRQEPKMQLIKTHYDENCDLFVSVPDVMDKINIGKITDHVNNEKYLVEVWEEKIEAYDCGDVIAAWFSKVLNKELRLVAVDPSQKRCDKAHELFSVPEGYVGSGVHFQDGFPVHLACESSVDELQKSITERSLSMRSFRPNIVVSDSTAFAEDDWGEIQIGNDLFYNIKPCDRCTMPNIDPISAKVYEEPRRTLREKRSIRHHRKPEELVQIFGINLLQKNSVGKIKVGDAIKILSKKDPLIFVPFE